MAGVKLLFCLFPKFLIFLGHPIPADPDSECLKKLNQVGHHQPQVHRFSYPGYVRG
jgi:hypothetical protein